MIVEIRKIVVQVEEIRHDGGPPLAVPVRKGWVAAVIRNPYAGRYEPEITPMMDVLKPLGIECSSRLVDALGGVEGIDAYGKGSIVGADGEVEHGALWHVPGGYSMRELLGQALAIVPSTAKLGALGAAIDIPLHHKDACYVRSHFDAVTVSVADAPRAAELVFVLAMASGGRPHARVGGLSVGEINKWDGLK